MSLIGKLVGDGRLVKIESGTADTESRMTYDAEKEEYKWARFVGIGVLALASVWVTVE